MQAGQRVCRGLHLLSAQTPLYFLFSYLNLIRATT